MFNILVPKNHFLHADYPGMEENILGLPIPIGWGNIHDIVPFCIDTAGLVFKIVDQAIEDIVEIRSKGIPLSAGSFTEDLAVAEFTLKGTPYIVEGETYYFAISGDYTIDGTNYLRLISETIHASQQGYEIDGADLWSTHAGRQLLFAIYGKERLDLDEELILGSFGIPIGTINLRDAAARTRVGCSFVAPAADRGFGHFVTRIRIFLSAPSAGTPAGNIWATLFSGINPDAQIGMQGDAVALTDPSVGSYTLTMPQDGEDSDLLADIESPNPKLVYGADILKDLFVSILGKPLAILEPTSLANLLALRTQELKVFVDRDTAVGDFIGKLEASLLWKFLPLQDGTYGTIVFEPGEPAGTPHFRDEDFLSFKIERDLAVVRNIVRIKYDENPATQEFKTAEATSDLARLFYSNEESIEIETWLRHDVDAVDLAEDYSYFFQEPQARIIFEVHGAGLNLLPGRDKVKITRSRAAWAGGSINGELFRIMRVTKRPATNTAEIMAVPDTRTYVPADVPEESGGGGFAFDTELYYVHGDEDRIVGVDLADFATDAIFVVGGAGSGDGEFSVPKQVALDDTYFYVADAGNNRIQKFLRADGSFVAKTAAGVVYRPWGCVCWDGKLYVSTYASPWHKIIILDADDLTKIGEFGSAGNGDDEFSGPRGMTTDGEHLYIGDYNNNRIKKHTLAGAFVGEIGSFGTGNMQFNGPVALATEGVYIIVCDYGNKRLQRFLASDLSFVSSVPCQTRGGVKGSPMSITVNGTHYYVGINNVAPVNGYIEKYVIATDAFVAYYDATNPVGGPMDTCWGMFILKEAA